jgi:TonB-linked SusC/RagA family outer membrane protein
MSQTLSAQKMSIKGQVQDSKGEAIMGANITVKGSKTGVISDMEGHYTIVASPTQTLTISFIGYITQNVAIKNRQVVNVTLLEDTKNLDEVVVVGYGTQLRKRVVGAVDNISGKVLENRPNAYLIRSLQGEVPGLNITMVDGKPSRSATINIRGNQQSIGAGGAALCLIDGVEGDLTAMNPADVESISVLKDASSCAVYGARGAFGVVLVTTKKARKDKISVNYNGGFTIYKQTVRPQLVTDGLTWESNFKESWMSAKHTLPTGINNLFPWSQDWETEYTKRVSDPDNSYLEWDLDSNGKYVYYGKGTNWYDEFYRNETYGQQHNLSVSGGSDKASFLVSARYFEQDGIYRVGDEKFRQMNVRAKGTVNITNWLTLEDNIDFVRRTYHQPMGCPASLTVPRLIEHQGYPVAILKNPDGTWTSAAIYTGYAGMADNMNYRDNYKYDMKNTVSLTANIIKNVLTAKVDYTYLYNHSTRKDIVNPVSYSQGPNFQKSYPLTGYLDARETENEYHNANASLSFSPKLGEDNSLNVLAGWNIEHKKCTSTKMVRTGFISSDKPNFSLMDGTDLTLADNGSYGWGFVGLFYRVSYAYKDKYLAEVSGRYDGSSKFPSSQQWGFFPSASLGWRMSEEKFMKKLSWLDNVKWRVSVGSAGNGNVSPYKYMQIMSFGKSSFLTDGNQETVTSAPTPVPESLTWEKSTTYDLGLDLGFFNSRLSFTGDIYKKTTTDMFVVGEEIPAVAGYSAPKGNNANMRTLGFEASVAWNDRLMLKGKPFSYNVRFSLWDSRSKITKYTSKTNTLPTVYSTNYYEGMELGEIWGYHVDGLFATDEEAQSWGKTAQSKTFWSGDNVSWQAGDIKFADLDNSGVVDNGRNTLADHGDLKKIGNTSPRYFYGINLGANWNGIGISLFFQGIMKKDWYPAAESSYFWGQYNRPYGLGLPWHTTERWTEENQNTDAYWPRLRGYLATSGRGTLRNANDRYLQNARYCRLKNVTVDYTLPATLTKKVHLENVRFYVSGENLFFWSPLKKHAKNFDPEQITAGDSDYSSTVGTDGEGYGYPQTKSVTFGVNVTF